MSDNQIKFRFIFLPYVGISLGTILCLVLFISWFGKALIALKIDEMFVYLYLPALLCLVPIWLWLHDRFVILDYERVISYRFIGIYCAIAHVAMFIPTVEILKYVRFCGSGINENLSFAFKAYLILSLVMFFLVMLFKLKKRKISG